MNSEKQLLHIGRYTISSEFFEKGFTRGAGPCQCTSTCCEGGVFVDVRERDTIMSHKDTIKKYMDETQVPDEAAWFEPNEFEDADFASGRCVGTQIINDKCAFLDKRGRCSLQIAATEEGMQRWGLKPLFCILYPLEISDNVVGFDDMLQDEQVCCSVGSGFELPLFEACREELTHLLGAEGYDAMKAHHARVHAAVEPVEDSLKG
jgi:hypothetical protein